MVELLWKLTVCVLMSVVQGKYFISQETSDAQDATQLCSLASPYSVTDGKLSPELSEAGISDGDKLWIGHARVYVALLYKGCCTKNYVPQNTIKRNIHKLDIGRCHDICDSAFVGIGIEPPDTKTCYCFGTPVAMNGLHQLCNQSCDSPSNTLCGEKNKVSVYEKVRYYDNVTIGSTNADTKRCRAYESTNNIFFWDSCHLDYLRICQTEQGTFTIHDQSNARWKTSMQTCLGNSEYPPEENHTHFPNGPDGVSPFWMGNIRTTSIISTSRKSGNEPGFKHGYILKENGNFKLLFNVPDRPIRALCNSGTTAQSTSSSSSVSTGTTTSETSSTTSSSTVTSGKETVTTTSPTTDTYTTSSSLSPSTGVTETQHNSSTGAFAAVSSGANSGNVAVYVAVPIVLLLIIAIIICIVVIKRKRSKQNRDKSECDTKPHSNGRGIIESMSNAAYQDDFSTAPKSDTANDNYCVLEPASEYAAIKDTDMDRTDNDEYDSTSAAQANRAPVTGNIYSKLDDVTDDPYNHCNTGSNIKEDTYNHIEAVKRKGVEGSQNDTYNHLEGISPNSDTPERQSFYSNTEDTDGTYNHTGGLIHEKNRDSLNPSGISNPITNSSDSNTNYGKPNYDYAYATKGDQNDTQKSGMFTLSQLPNSDDYEFAKEPPTTADGYALATSIPAPIYLELSNE